MPFQAGSRALSHFFGARKREKRPFLRVRAIAFLPRPNPVLHGNPPPGGMPKVYLPIPVLDSMARTGSRAAIVARDPVGDGIPSIFLCKMTIFCSPVSGRGPVTGGGHVPTHGYPSSYRTGAL